MKNGRVALLVPSRGRPKAFARLVDSFLANGTGYSDLILRNGEADPVKDEYAMFEGIPGVIRVVGTDQGFNSFGTAGYNPAQEDLWERFSDYSAYISIEDDCVLETPGFDQWLLAEFDRFPGRVGLIELYDRSQTIHCPCLSAEWCDALGYLFLPGVGEHGFHQVLQLAQADPPQYLVGTGAHFTHYPHLREYGYTGNERKGALATPGIPEQFHQQAIMLARWRQQHFRGAKDALLRKAGQ